MKLILNQLTYMHWRQGDTDDSVQAKTLVTRHPWWCAGFEASFAFVLEPNSVVKFGWAILSPEDSNNSKFSRRKGRELALGRLTNAPLHFSASEGPTSRYQLHRDNDTVRGSKADFLAAALLSLGNAKKIPVAHLWIVEAFGTTPVMYTRKDE